MGDSEITAKDLESEFGCSIKPKELAEFLGLDIRTVVKYARYWGGVEVYYAINEKFIPGVLHEGQHICVR